MKTNERLNTLTNACTVCTIKKCENCPVKMQISETRYELLVDEISALKKQVEDLIRRTNNSKNTSYVKPKASLSITTNDPELEWINKIKSSIKDFILWYKLDTNTSKVLTEVATRMRDIYGFVYEQSKKEYKYNIPHSDDEDIKFLQVIYNSGIYKDIFENLLSNYRIELTKDKIPVSPEPVIKDFREVIDEGVQKQKKKTYKKRNKNYYKYNDIISDKINKISEMYGYDSRITSKIIINILRLDIGDPELDRYTCANDDFLFGALDQLMNFALTDDGNMLILSAHDLIPNGINKGHKDKLREVVQEFYVK